MMPDEKLTTTLQKPGELYFIDAHVFGGNSGAPVVVTPGFPSGAKGAYLLGVVSGYFFETEDFKLEIASTLEGRIAANSGISIVVPASQLKTVLDSPSLEADRVAEIARVPAAWKR